MSCLSIVLFLSLVSVAEAAELPSAVPGIPAAQVVPVPLLQPRILISSHDGRPSFTYIESADFNDPRALLSWIASHRGRPTSMPLIIQFDDSVSDQVLTELVAQLSACGTSNLALAPPSDYLAPGEAFTRTIYQEHPHGLFMNMALEAGYTQKFGAQADRFMMMDLERMLVTGHVHMVTQLIQSLPRLPLANGQRSPFIRVPDGMQLSERALQAWMVAALDPALDVETRRVLLFGMGWLNDRRCVQFLISCTGQPWSMWEHSGEMLALLCLRYHDEILAQNEMTMSPYSAGTPQEHAQFIKDGATMRAWYAANKAFLPQQIVLPSSQP